ncbi:hypothetical protein [Hoeflea sp. EC-HK425]|uniref:hypothetical protein n=1 Tax=Hoeflea sp. EC-HK425 TaxID=2038388 RepID=UPI0012517A03|nr:hypothetical protein [Hoeflea sp. EC-HK425]VVT15375.1 hypothetical protein HOE425_331222 [Hoeflea sp. EC-HK425]
MTRSITIIDGTRLTEERARAAREPDAPAVASIVVILAFVIGCGLLAIVAGA